MISFRSRRYCFCRDPIGHRYTRRAALALLSWVALAGAGHAVAAEGRPFTLADDIGTSRFSDTFSESFLSRVSVSPDGSHFAVITERGSLARDRIEDRLWIFSRDEVAARLEGTQAPRSKRGLRPALVVTAREGPVMTHVTWLEDSSGLAFLSPDEHGGHELSVFSLQGGKAHRLSMQGQNVTAFNLNHGQVAYSTLSPIVQRHLTARRDAAAFDATGQGLYDLLFTSDLYPDQSQFDSLCDLWVVRRNGAVRVERHGKPVHLHQPFETYLGASFWISPDGAKVLVKRPAPEVPKSWEEFTPSADLPARRIKAGPQLVDENRISDAVEVFEVLDVNTGAAWRPAEAPTGWRDAYYWVDASAAWSADGRSFILANTFIAPALDTGEAGGGRPCVAVVRLQERRISCAFRLYPSKASYMALGIDWVTGVRFAGRDSHHIELEFEPEGGVASSPRKDMWTWSFREAQGRWIQESRQPAAESHGWPFRLDIGEGLNRPPTLWARASGGRGVMLLDPNPDLAVVELGEAKPYQWLDRAGRKWSGGLVKPPQMVVGKRYPLVIQTHGFDDSRFLTAGAFTTDMAARELAASGVLVLQVAGADNTDSLIVTPKEGPLQVDGYESAVRQLTKEGLVDPSRVGLVGFSRTVFGVMEALVDGRLRPAAAVIADGIQVSYPEYLFNVDYAGNLGRVESDSMIGARPFGDGLRAWLQRSPQFRLDRSTTPLLVFAHGPSSLLDMWPPYAALRAMGKPTDIIVLNTGEHILTRPRERLVSQGGTLDWFRFWLQGYEDPDPAKASQYRRWEGLRTEQNQNARAEQEYSRSTSISGR